MSPTKVFFLQLGVNDERRVTLEWSHNKGWNDTQIARDHTQNAMFLIKARKMSTYCLDDGTTVPKVTRTM